MASGNSTDFKTAIMTKESSGNQYSINPSGYVGLFQFGESALIDLGYYKADGTKANDWKGKWTGKDGITSLQSFLDSANVQNTAFDAWIDKLWSYGVHYGLDQYVGSKLADGTVVTVSGLVAGLQLVGSGGMIALLKNGIQSKDGNNTTAASYVKKFGGYTLSVGKPSSHTASTLRDISVYYGVQPLAHFQYDQSFGASIPLQNLVKGETWDSINLAGVGPDGEPTHKITMLIDGNLAGIKEYDQSDIFNWLRNFSVTEIHDNELGLDSSDGAGSDGAGSVVDAMVQGYGSDDGWQNGGYFYRPLQLLHDGPPSDTPITNSVGGNEAASQDSVNLVKAESVPSSTQSDSLNNSARLIAEMAAFHATTSIVDFDSRKGFESNLAIFASSFVAA